MAFAQSARPIAGAVATLGVSDRVTFLRKTYAHLSIAVIAFAALTAGILKYATTVSWKFSVWAVDGGRWNWGAVIIAFMAIGWIAERLARSQASRVTQYAGLFLGVLGWAVIFQPMIWVLIANFNTSFDHAHPTLNGQAAVILGQSVVITLAIFVGLTLTVFVTRKDFSFMRGILAIAMFGALGLVAGSILFGYSLGAWFSVAMIVVMAGQILFQTSMVMRDFPPQGYVAASLLLFSSLAMLLWYVLRLLMALNRR